MRYAGRFVYELTADDIGKRTLYVNRCKCQTCGHNRGEVMSLVDFLGYVQPCDVGKRIYSVDGVYQVENDEQLARRGA